MTLFGKKEKGTWFHVPSSSDFGFMAEALNQNLDEFINSGKIDTRGAKTAFIKAVIKKIAQTDAGLDRNILQDVSKLPFTLLEEEKEERL